MNLLHRKWSRLRMKKLVGMVSIAEINRELFFHRGVDKR